MSLEILQRLPTNRVTETPLIFVHGAFAGAWCWDEHFLPYLAEQGYSAYALSLRGHANSKGDLHTAGVADYVEDVVEICERFKKPPVLIGHSMGGAVVQKFLEDHPARAAVLMNSVPPTGLSSSIMYMMFTSPLLLHELSLMQNVSPHFGSINTMRQALFSKDMSDSEIEPYLMYSQGESGRITFDLLGFNLPNVFKIPKIPMLVLGAENDAFFPVSVIRNTAETYSADLHIFANTAHAMMLERNWREVADYMITWLKKQKI